MITKEQRDQELEALANNSQGKALLNLLDEKIKSLDSVRGCSNLKEVLAKKDAIKIIEDIFKFLKRKEYKKETIKPNQYL